MSEKIARLDKSVIDMVYPVGAIYMSVNSTNPGNLFGGKWEQIKDRFLLAAGDTHAAGSTGGEEQHTLAFKEIPGQVVINRSPTKKISLQGVKRNYISIGTDEWAFASNADFESTEGVKITNGPHNNMPPYLTVYMWKRTA
jgi:hypothetical protein